LLVRSHCELVALFQLYTVHLGTPGAVAVP
jgi:hypothetical protein